MHEKRVWHGRRLRSSAMESHRSCRCDCRSVDGVARQRIGGHALHLHFLNKRTKRFRGFLTPAFRQAHCLFNHHERQTAQGIAPLATPYPRNPCAPQWCRAHHCARQLAPCLDLDHVDLPARRRPQARQAAERRIFAPGLTVLGFCSRPDILAEEGKTPRWLPSSTQERFYVKPGNSFRGHFMKRNLKHVSEVSRL